MRHKPYDRTTHDGKAVNWRTKAMLLEMEDRLGYRLTVVQGSYNKGVGPSAGTHDGGGAVDLSAYDWPRKVTCGRRVGFAMWHRPTLHASDGSLVWNEHNHGIALDDHEASDAATDQMGDYRAGRDGLAGGGLDTFEPHPVHVFDYLDWQRSQSLRKRLRRLVRKSERSLARAAAKSGDKGLRAALGRLRAYLRRSR